MRLLSISFKQGRPDQYRDPGAVLAEVFLLERLTLAGLGELLLGAALAVMPFRRRLVPPANSAGREIGALESEHAEKRVVRLDDDPGAPDEDADDVGIDQARRILASRCWRSR